MKKIGFDGAFSVFVCLVFVAQLLMIGQTSRRLDDLDRRMDKEFGWKAAGNATVDHEVRRRAQFEAEVRWGSGDRECGECIILGVPPVPGVRPMPYAKD